MLTGTKDERAEIIATSLITQKFQVCITTYKMCLIETAALKKSLSSILSATKPIESKTLIPYFLKLFTRSSLVDDFSSPEHLSQRTFLPTQIYLSGNICRVY